ncbi:MAG: hypothetical protein WC956_05790, partial [bacterium]
MRQQGKGKSPTFHGKKHGRRGRRPGKRERALVGEEGRLKERADSAVAGELRLHRDGYGFVVPMDGGTDLFVPAKFIGDALHTDLVEARVVAESRGKREGRIVKVVEHRVQKLMGRLERHGRLFQVVADDRRVHHRIIVAPDKLSGARDGQNVIVHILKYPEGDQPMQGEVVQILGNRGEEETEREAVVARHQLRREFNRAALGEAKSTRSLMTEEE